MTDAGVNLWGRRIGAVSWDAARGVGVFQYEPDFVRAGIELSPLVMPVREAPYAFPALGRDAFKGLPGLLADAMPDAFGNTLIDAWLHETGRDLATFNPVDRLCYLGRRGMGALEFEPVIRSRPARQSVDVAGLVELANRVLVNRARLAGRLVGEGDARALDQILRVGTSAGGARAKAVLAWNPRTGEFRSGQVDAAAGFQPWLLKFDGIVDNRDREIGDSLGYGRIEYAYSLMATDAGIEMMPCRLHHEGGRSHFMTRRFDRDASGRKRHMQSLGALRHFDYNLAGAYAYEQAMRTISALGLGVSAVEQQFRRTVFNVVARNQDDHVKNISFLMDRNGAWQLSPAYDLTYAHNPDGAWTGQHQMSTAGKRRGFERSDLLRFGDTSGLSRALANRLIDQVVSAVQRWPEFAAEAGVADEYADRIGNAHRLGLGGG